MYQDVIKFCFTNHVPKIQLILKKKKIKKNNNLILKKKS